MTGGQVRTRLMVDGTLLVELRGRLDMVCGKALGDQLAADVLARRPSHIEVDLEQVTFIHDSALDGLLRVREAADGIGASVRMVNPSPVADRLPQTAGVGAALERQPVGA